MRRGFFIREIRAGLVSIRDLWLDFLKELAGGADVR